MIFTKTRYKTDNQKLLVIIEAFKIWRYYFEGYKYKGFIFTNYNNLHQFMDRKSLSFCQLCRAQELFWYHFGINYRQ